LIHGLAQQRRVVDREAVEQGSEWLAAAVRPHHGVGRRHHAMQRADRIGGLGERECRPQPIPGFVDLFPIVKRGFEGLRRPPHLAKPAVAGKMEDVVPIGMGDDQQDEGLEIGGDDPGLAFGRDVQHVLRRRQQREYATPAVASDLPKCRNAVHGEPGRLPGFGARLEIVPLAQSLDGLGAG
jgi:hypothetical protein